MFAFESKCLFWFDSLASLHFASDSYRAKFPCLVFSCLIALPLFDCLPGGRVAKLPCHSTLPHPSSTMWISHPQLIPNPESLIHIPNPSSTSHPHAKLPCHSTNPPPSYKLLRYKKRSFSGFLAKKKATFERLSNMVQLILWISLLDNKYFPKDAIERALLNLWVTFNKTTYVTPNVLRWLTLSS